MKARLAMVLCCAALGACSDNTELLLRVIAAPGLTFGPGQDIDALRIQAQLASEGTGLFYLRQTVELCPESSAGTADCRPQEYADADYAGALTLPIRFLLQPGPDIADEDVRVWIDGLHADYSPPERITDGVRFRFARGRRLWLDVTLYRECLDNPVSCEKLDEVCGEQRSCTPITPTENEPSPPVTDLAVLTGDMAMAPTCGDKGLACCAGGQCATGLMCTTQGADGSCIDPAVTCGQIGQACCTAPAQACADSCSACDTALTHTCLRSAGLLGQACCNGSCTLSDTICHMGVKCVSCGGQDEPVCASGACDGSLEVVGGFCRFCGSDMAACCTSSDMSPCMTALACVNSGSNNNTCESCGGPGQPCCNQGCTDSTFACQGNMCVPCGTKGGPCCAGATPCMNGGTCTGATTTNGSPVSMSFGVPASPNSGTVDPGTCM